MTLIFQDQMGSLILNPQIPAGFHLHRQILLKQLSHAGRLLRWELLLGETEENLYAFGWKVGFLEEEGSQNQVKRAHLLF